MASSGDFDTAGHARSRRDHWLARAEHVWITNVSGMTREKHPGILLAWRRDPVSPREWQGWVICARPGIGAHGDGPYVSQGWIEAGGIERRG